MAVSLCLLGFVVIDRYQGGIKVVLSTGTSYHTDERCLYCFVSFRVIITEKKFIQNIYVRRRHGVVGVHLFVTFILWY